MIHLKWKWHIEKFPIEVNLQVFRYILHYSSCFENIKSYVSPHNRSVFLHGQLEMSQKSKEGSRTTSGNFPILFTGTLQTMTRKNYRKIVIFL